MVTCRQCVLFREPDSKYEPDSLGFCTYFDNWLDKFNGRKPTPKQYDEAYKSLGDRLWYPNIERKCKKYVEKK